MHSTRLGTDGKRAIRKASRSIIEDYYINMRRGSVQWLSKTNRYRLNCVNQYAKDRWLNTVDHNHVISYVAASGPTHTIDGWSFLGRAVDSTLRGDKYSAIHFGYYAELRAAMALLACEGIGILNNKHPYIESSISTIPLPKGEEWDNKRRPTPGYVARDLGTHKVATPCLQHWSTLVKAESLIDEIVQPNGLPLSRWFEACNANKPTRAIGQRWLMAWGLDLSFVDDDRDLRNLVSYRPSELRPSPSLNPVETLAFIEELWRLFEPSIGSRFPFLERNLLRKALHLAGIRRPRREDLENLGINSAEASEWVSFLSESSEHPVMSEAAIKPSLEDSRCHLQIIARATLLLYFATSAARRLLRNGGFSAELLSFWWRGHGLARGLWDETNNPDNPLDLWADVEARIADSAAWRQSRAGSPTSFKLLRESQGAVLNEFGALELAGIWVLLP